MKQVLRSKAREESRVQLSFCISQLETIAMMGALSSSLFVVEKDLEKDLQYIGMNFIFVDFIDV